METLEILESPSAANGRAREPWTREEFVAALRALRARYHHLHPFHVRMNAGQLSREELQRWVANRFYYQRMIPRKDAAILANCPEEDVRREWMTRVLDHDGAPGAPGASGSSSAPGTPEASGAPGAFAGNGRSGTGDEPGGIEKWLRLGEAIGVPREELVDERHVLPAVRFAVNAYLDFCRTRPWIEAVASSLTELFGPDAIRERIPALEAGYPWIDPAGFAYFRARLHQAPRDAQYALNLVVERCRTRAAQDRAVSALAFKCDVLWVQLDAIERGDTRPAMPNAPTWR